MKTNRQIQRQKLQNSSSNKQSKLLSQQWDDAFVSLCTPRRLKFILAVAVITLSGSTWRIVRLAHNTLPIQENFEFDDSRSLTTGSSNSDSKIYEVGSNQDKVPFLPPLPKPKILPSFLHEVKPWMMTLGNETAGQFLLDFAIIGNAKCGTSTIMEWLYQHTQIQIPRDELYHLKSMNAWDLLGVFYHYFGVGKLRPSSIKGYKSPSDITNERSLRLLRTFFPKTKLVIGLRHPIYMMESFYNFRIQNGYDLPPFDKLHYRNLANQYAVSWSRAEYHTTLMYLGKTNVLSQDELSLMPRPAKKQIEKRFQERNDNPNNTSTTVLNPPYPRMPNPVFLYETAQLADDNATRLTQFCHDVENYLGLSSERESLPFPHRMSPGKTIQNQTLQAERDAKKIRICDERYIKQRQLLLEIGHRASEWILNCFVKADDVYVSNLQHFRQILEGYKNDPCIS